MYAYAYMYVYIVCCVCIAILVRNTHIGQKKFKFIEYNC